MRKIKMDYGVAYEIPVSEDEFDKIVYQGDANVLRDVLDDVFENHSDYEVHLTDKDDATLTITVRAVC